MEEYEKPSMEVVEMNSAVIITSCENYDDNLVAIQPPSSRLNKYDVALYRRDQSYVLHRVIRVADGHYLIRGDNTYSLETVPDEAVIGVLTSFKRKGREISTAARG